MYKQINYIVLGLAVLVFTVRTAEAQYTSHNTQHGINCVDCHFAHGGNSLVPRGAEQEILCKTCHNPTDRGAENTHLWNITNHVTSGGEIDCGSCHEVHNPNDPQSPNNIKRVRGNTDKYVTGALDSAIYDTQDVFVQPAYDGICQSCHLNTNYYRQNGGASHETAVCTTCHTHEDGFIVNCTGCHATAQDNGTGVTRRAVVGEFSLTSHHVLNGTVTSADCVVCHTEVYGTDNHGNELIDLRDPIDGTALTGFTQFTSSEYTYVQENFCLKCHDGNGAEYLTSPANPLRPFSSDIGYDVPNVYDALNPTNDYYHPVQGAGTNTFCNATTMEPGMDNAILTCFDCHTANGHGSSNQRTLLDPIDFATMEAATTRNDLSTITGTPVETFCSRCHSSSVYVSGADGSVFEFHGTDQSQHGAAGNNELGCMGCHAGTVNLIELDGQDNPIYDNGAARGNIHGGNFTWPTGSWTEGEDSPSFLLGGFLDGYKLQGSWSNKNNWWEPACGGGQCNHNGGTKYWTPVAD
jgi:hypothetical protein